MPRAVVSTAPEAESRARVLRGALLVVVVLLAYLPALRAGFVWDDDAHVTENPTLTSLAGLERIWLEPTALPQYYPLVHTTFWIERHLWGLEPAGYHLVNALLHALNALLLGLLLERLRVPGAWLAAALFAVHPVHVESVAWVTERKNVLSGTFYLAAAICLLRFYGETGNPPGRRRWYAAGAALFVCALLSKTVTATLPLAVLLVLWWKRGRVAARDLIPLAPLAAAGGIAGLGTLWLETHHVGAHGVPWGLTLLDRLLLAGRLLWFYAGKIVWPAQLSFFYPRWRIDSGDLLQALFPLAAVGAGIVLWTARHRIGRGPAAAAAFFAVSLLPALGFFDVYPMRFSWAADHFQYLASIGLLTLLAAAGTGLAQRFRPQAGAWAAGAVIVLLAVLTWRQCRAYESAETLWRDTIAKNPGSATPRNNLAVILMARGDLEAAMQELREAVRLDPEAWIPHKNLGDALRREGRAEEAIEEYTRALEINPAIAQAHHGLGDLLAERGERDAAVAHYEEALRLEPSDPATAFNLGSTLAEAGRPEEAIARFEEALRLDPAHSEARVNLGNALASLGRPADAIAQYEQALRDSPDLAEGHNNLGAVLARQGRNAEAIEHYRRALRIQPDYPDAANNLGLALTGLGRLSEAIDAFRTAIASRPDYPEAENNLGVALARAGQGVESLAHFESALRLRPDFEEARANLAAVRGAAGRR